MEVLKQIWDADWVLLQLGDYPLSFLEFMGTLTGLVAVYLAVRANVLTWPAGIINQVFFFLLFYQVQLYSDMLLQLVFFVVSVYGWLNWRKGGQEDLEVGHLNNQTRAWLLLTLMVGTLALGWAMGQIHLWLPRLFNLPAAFPFGDAFTSVASIIAIVLQARKKLESWWLWIALDVVAIGIYWAKDIRFIAGEYVVFLLLSSWGLWQWQKLLRHSKAVK